MSEIDKLFQIVDSSYLTEQDKLELSEILKYMIHEDSIDYDKCSTTINLINSFINSLTLDEIFRDDYINKYVLDKYRLIQPFKDLPIDIKNSETFFTQICDDRHKGLLTATEISFSDESTRTTPIKSPFTEKKELLDLTTDLMSSNVLFNDMQKNTLYYFQYLINTTFNTIIKKYIEKNNYMKESILFLYKGGTSMTIIYKKYKDILTKNTKLIDFLSKMFKRSDSDYQIVINNGIFNNIDSYNKIIIDMTKISIYLLIKIRNFINNNYECIVPLQNISIDILKKQLELFNTKIKEGNYEYISKIDKFIGFTFNDINYFSEVIPDVFEQVDNEFNSPGDEELSNEMILFSENKKVNSSRNDLIITVNKKDDKFYSKIINITNEKKNTIYLTVNDSIKFKNNGNYSSFILARLKINFIFYFKTKENKYGFLKIPSELVDVSISKFEDYKINYVEKIQTMKNYKYKELIYTSYNIIGFIKDLLMQLIVEVPYSWRANKYEKKIFRMIFLFIIFILNEYTTNSNTIITNIIYFINNPSEKNLINIGMKNDNNNNVILSFFKKILIYNNETLTSNIADRKKYLQFIKFINDIFDLYIIQDIKPEMFDEPESIPYLNKYLKYKNKYLALKSKITN